MINPSSDKDKKATKLPSKNELIEGIHFYMEAGFMVFTETYHKLRGTCCESACRHCPYGFKK